LITPDAVTTIGTIAVPFLQWAHIAVTFDGSTYKGYVNGTLAVTYASSNVNNVFTSIYIGWRTGTPTLGNIPMCLSNFRISRLVRYSGNFSVPTAGFTADLNTISLNTFSAATFSNGEIGLGISLYRGGLYYNRIYSVYIVGHQYGLAPIYIMSNRNMAYGDVLVDLPTGYSSTNIRQLPFYIVTEDSVGSELALKQYYFMKNLCITAVSNGRLPITSTTSTSYGAVGTNFGNYIPPNIKRYKVGLQINDLTASGTMVRLADDNVETNFVDVVSGGGVLSYQYVDAPCYAGNAQVKLADNSNSTTASMAVVGFYMDDS
jgi:hypothetical protein